MKACLLFFLFVLLSACSSTGVMKQPNKEDLFITAIANDPVKMECYELLVKAKKSGAIDEKLFKASKYRCLGGYYVGGNGLSYDKAIIFPVAESSYEGIALETRWIRENYPNFIKTEQKIVETESKKYDVISIKNQEGQLINLFFDMTNWYGISN